MTPPKPSAHELNVVVIDPWVSTTPAHGHDRTAALVRTLIAATHRVTFIAARTRDEDHAFNSAVVRRALAPQSRRFGYPPTSQTGFAYGLRTTLSLIRQTKADVIVLRVPPFAGGFMLGCFAAFSGAPLLIDAPELFGKNQSENQLQRLAHGFMLRMLRWKTRHVFAGSPEIKSWFETQKFDPELISVHPFGSDTELFIPTRDIQTVLFEKYPHLAKGPLCVYAGNIHRGRNIAELLEVAAAMLPIAPDLRFAIVGDGPDRLDLNAYAARLDVLEKNLWFIPAVTRAELGPILNAATVVIAIPPRWHDGGLDAGNHIFDGLAAGKPIAVLGEGWQRELIEGRQAGVALPGDNTEAAARELADFLRDSELVRRAGEQALALARGKHNCQRIVTDVRHTIEKIATLHSRQEVWRQRSLRLKRVIDVMMSLAMLLVLSPLFFVIVAGFIACGWLPFAGRMRSGLRGKAFRVFTFDTMKTGRANDQPEFSWRNSFLNVLRRSALDRLPELLNVLIGNMSLIGPRPLPGEYKAFYTETQQRRLDVRPGITGWAQVSGRQGFTWDEMFAHDAWYVDHRSFWLDLKILWKTIVGLLLGRGLGALPAGQLPRFDEIEARRQGAEDV